VTCEKKLMSGAMSSTVIDSPFGPMGLAGTEHGVTRVNFQHTASPVVRLPNWQYESALLARAVQQLQEYFQGVRQHFTVPLAPLGTPFQQLVWEELQRIPYGTTITYQELARRVGNLNAARAVGHANGRNSIAIIIPCHRVVGQNGQLRGYAGGLAMKQRLLQHEGAWPL
jgi:methylated-DNA-[protein]-cysteine S-methyltransferase